MSRFQLQEQYEAIFEALLELFTVPDTSIPKKEFCQYILDQEQKKLPQNQKLYKLEFQVYFIVIRSELKEIFYVNPIHILVNHTPNFQW